MYAYSFCLQGEGVLPDSQYSVLIVYQAYLPPGNNKRKFYDSCTADQWPDEPYEHNIESKIKTEVRLKRNLKNI